MDKIHIKYRDRSGEILDHAKSPCDIIICDAKEYGLVYIKIGEFKDNTYYLNDLRDWDLSYYAHEGLDDNKIQEIKDQLYILVNR